MLQVAVGDNTAGVVTGDERVLDVLGKGKPPKEGVSMAVEVGATHSGFGCVGRAQKGRLFRDDFGQVSGPGSQIRGEGPKRFDVMTQGFCDPDASIGCASEGQL